MTVEIEGVIAGRSVRLLRSSVDSPILIFAHCPDTGELVRIELPANCMIEIPENGESTAEQLRRLDGASDVVDVTDEYWLPRGLDADDARAFRAWRMAGNERVLALARKIGEHWRDQEGINGAMLDELAETTKP